MTNGSKWTSPSIKDSERNDRASVTTNFQVTRSSQKRPSNWLEAMKNTSFKISLNKYLVESWNDNSLVDLIGEKTLYVNCCDTCYKYQVVLNVLFVVMRQDCTAITKKQIHACFFMFHVWLKIIVVPLTLMLLCDQQIQMF